MRRFLRFRLTSLFAVVTAACFLAWIASYYFKRVPEKRFLVISFVQFADQKTEWRQFWFRHNEWHATYFDFPPYGLPDKVAIRQQYQHKTFFSSHYTNNTSRRDVWDPSQTMTPEMERESEELIEFLKKQCPGQTLDEVFAPLNFKCRFFPLEVDQLIGPQAKSNAANKVVKSN